MARMPYIVRKCKKSKSMGSPGIINPKDIEAMQVDARLELFPSVFLDLC